MARVKKTAISVEESLFEQADALAREMKTSRSHLFVLALEDFIRRRDNRRMLERINTAYEGAPERSEEALQRRMRRVHRRVVEGEW